MMKEKAICPLQSHSNIVMPVLMAMPMVVVPVTTKVRLHRANFVVDFLLFLPSHSYICLLALRHSFFRLVSSCQAAGFSVTF